MSDTSRRKFLAVAGAGTAAGAAGAASVLSGGPAAAASSVRSKHASRTPVVAFVEQPTSDVVHLMVDDREIVVEDRELVTRILNAAGRK